MKRFMLPVAVLMVLPGHAAAQKWAKARLDKSPRYLEWVKVKQGIRNHL